MNETYTGTCPVTGDSDLYGLGMRIGIYIQMFTVQISGMTSGLLRVDDLLGQATVIFILSVGTVLFQQIRKAVIEPVEVFPIITLLLAQAAVCRVPYWRGQLTVLIYVGELVALISLFLWFWWIGMDTLPRSCDKDYAFFFAKVNIWGWYRKFNQATSVLIAITGFSSALFYMIYFLTRGTRFLWELIVDARPRQNDRTDNEPAQVGGIDIAINIGMVVYVEMALKWNNISGVHSLSTPGQFMPFFIALVQLLATLYQVSKLAFQVTVDKELTVLNVDDDDDLECCHGDNSSEAGHDNGIILQSNPA